MIKDEIRHHRKCLFKYGEVCRCNEIYTPPTIPRYQRQLMEKAKKLNEMKINQAKEGKPQP